MLASAVVNLVNSIRLREMPRRLTESKVGCASLKGRYKRQQCKAKVNEEWNPALKAGGPIKQAGDPKETKAKQRRELGSMCELLSS